MGAQLRHVVNWALCFQNLSGPKIAHQFVLCQIWKKIHIKKPLLSLSYRCFQKNCVKDFFIETYIEPTGRLCKASIYHPRIPRRLHPKQAVEHIPKIPLSVPMGHYSIHKSYILMPRYKNPTPEKKGCRTTPSRRAFSPFLFFSGLHVNLHAIHCYSGKCVLPT